MSYGRWHRILLEQLVTWHNVGSLLRYRWSYVGVKQLLEYHWLMRAVDVVLILDVQKL